VENTDNSIRAGALPQAEKTALRAVIDAPQNPDRPLRHASDTDFHTLNSCHYGLSKDWGRARAWTGREADCYDASP